MAVTCTGREFRDAVFEDVGFHDNSVLTLKTEGVGTAHLKLIWWGFEHSILKPHILKHHIPEHPRRALLTYSARRDLLERFARLGPCTTAGCGHALAWFTTQTTTTTTCVPSFFCPRSRTTSEVVVRRAFGLHFQQKLVEV